MFTLPETLKPSDSATLKVRFQREIVLNRKVRLGLL